MAELAIGIVGVVDVCLHWGTELITACHALAEADSRLKESILRVECGWLRTQYQIELVRHLDSLLEDWHRKVQQQTLEILLMKLRAVNTKLASVCKPRKPQSDDSPGKAGTTTAKRFKYVFVRDSLAEAIRDLEDWQSLFDPIWFLMMKMASPEVDRQLQLGNKQSGLGSQRHIGTKQPNDIIPAARHVRRAIHTTDSEAPQSINILSAEGLVPSSVKAIPLSSAKLAQRVDNGDFVVLDIVTYASNPQATTVKRDIRNFAQRLKHADPTSFGLLQCKGIIQEENHTNAAGGLSFVFRLPPTHTEVQTLRERLLRGPPGQHESLSGRLDLARQLANAISYVHLYEFVHKNIRPETILNIYQTVPGLPVSSSELRGQDDAVANEFAVLIGFDVFRDIEGRTLRLGDNNWERNLYRHPQRQGGNPSSDYEIRHDIYSLGVCLLEIGLWESFVVYEKPNAGQQTTEDKGPWLGSELSTDVGSLSGSKLLKDPREVKKVLLSLARGRLRRKVGTKYSKVVETCLTCLDSGNEDFGDEKEFRDELGIAVGVRYIEKVVAKLAEITI